MQGGIENKVDQGIGSKLDIFDREVRNNDIVENSNFWNWFTIKYGADRMDELEEKFLIDRFTEYSMVKILRSSIENLTNLSFGETSKNFVNFQLIKDYHSVEYTFITDLFTIMHDTIFKGWGINKSTKFEGLIIEFIKYNLAITTDFEYEDVLVVDRRIAAEVFNSYDENIYYSFYISAQEFWNYLNISFKRKRENGEL